MLEKRVENSNFYVQNKLTILAAAIITECGYDERYQPGIPIKTTLITMWDVIRISGFQKSTRNRGF